VSESYDLSSLPPDKKVLLAKVVDRLRAVRGIEAVVLGGSWARQVARPDSDLDVGIYYDPERAFSIEDIRAIAEEFSVSGTTPTIAGFYEWGPWVNGGAWIQTRAGKMDLLYSNVVQVRQVIEEARNGVWRHDYDQQPPFGFRSVIYLAETKVCVPLSDPNGTIAALKDSVKEYPPKLKQRVVQDCLWGSEFTFFAGGAAAERGDVYCTAGCVMRVAQYLTQALFALNEEYFISDKNASRLIEKMEHCPTNYDQRLSAISGYTGGTVNELRRSVELLEHLWRDVVALGEGLYQPRYKLRGN
jgi:hypothetical protein